MKTSENTGNTIKKTYDLPREICEKLEISAKENLRSINFELIYILQEYFKSRTPKLEPWIAERIEKMIKDKYTTFSWMVNHLLGMAIMEYYDDEKPVQQLLEKKTG